LISVSQEELGEKLGITFQQIQKYEKGTNRISASRLWEMSGFLNVPVDFFFDGLKVGSVKQSPEVALIAQFTSSREGMSMIRAFTEIEDPNLRNKFLQLLQAMSENS